jgi:hypothetical protein
LSLGVALFQRLFIWPLFAALMGFAIGGSVFWGLYGPNMPIQDISKSAENHATKHEAKSKKEESDEALAYYTLWLMVFTGVLAFATVGLGVATIGLYFTGEKQIKIGMRASLRQFHQTRQSLALTKRSADAAIKLELPVLRAWPGQIVYKDKPTEDGVGVGGGVHGHANFPRYSNLNYIAFSNDGRTAATPKSLSLGYHAGLELPAIPHYRRIMHFPEHLIIRNQVGSDSDSDWKAETYLAINLT